MSETNDTVQIKIPKGQVIVIDGVISVLQESIKFKAKLIEHTEVGDELTDSKP